QALIPDAHPTALLRGRVAGFQNAAHRVAVFVSFSRRSARADTLDEMPHLRLVAVCESLFGQRTRPAEIDVRLFHHISGAGGSERLYWGAARHIGEDGAFGSMDLIAQIKAALGGPGEFAMRYPAAGHLHRKQRIVLSLGALRMNQGAEPGRNFNYRIVLTEEVARRRNAMRG